MQQNKATRMKQSMCSSAYGAYIALYCTNQPTFSPIKYLFLLANEPSSPLDRKPYSIKHETNQK